MHPVTGIDPTDPCLDFTQGPTVSWRVTPTATLSGTATICPGELASLSITFTGTGPYNYVYSDGATQFNGTATLSPISIAVSPTATKTYSLVSLTGAGNCPGTINGSGVITVVTPPTATISGAVNLCPGGNSAFQIQMTGTAPYTLVMPSTVLHNRP